MYRTQMINLIATQSASEARKYPDQIYKPSLQQITETLGRTRWIRLAKIQWVWKITPKPLGEKNSRGVGSWLAVESIRAIADQHASECEKGLLMWPAIGVAEAAASSPPPIFPHAGQIERPAVGSCAEIAGLGASFRAFISCNSFCSIWFSLLSIS